MNSRFDFQCGHSILSTFLTCATDRSRTQVIFEIENQNIAIFDDLFSHFDNFNVVKVNYTLVWIKLGYQWMGDDIGLGLWSMAVCFDFRSNNVVQLSNHSLYFYQFPCHNQLITQLYDKDIQRWSNFLIKLLALLSKLQCSIRVICTSFRPEN